MDIDPALILIFGAAVFGIIVVIIAIKGRKAP
jgi:hypothetical protein